MRFTVAKAFVPSRGKIFVPMLPATRYKGVVNIIYSQLSLLSEPWIIMRKRLAETLTSPSSEILSLLERMC